MEIYKITNIITNKVYIGKNMTCDKNYYGSGVYIKSSIKKYGKNNFVKEIIDVSENYEELSEKEKYWINFYKNKNLLYNITEGGDGGDTWSKNPKLESLKSKYFKKVVIDGIKYESITEASKLLNLDRNVIKHRLKSYNYQNYLYEEDELNIINNKYIDKFENRRKKVCVDGVIYDSVTDACKKLNRPHYYVLWRLQSNSYKNWSYLTDCITNKTLKTGSIKLKPVIINGCLYESISDAVKKTGIKREIMKYRLKSKKYTEYTYVN